MPKEYRGKIAEAMHETISGLHRAGLVDSERLAEAAEHSASEIPALTIRPAVNTDLICIVHLLWDDDIGKTREEFAEPLAKNYRTAFDEIIRDPANLMLIAELHGRIVAYVQLTFVQSLSYKGARRAFLEDLRVRRDVRNSGIGRQLMQSVVRIAKERGCRILQLLVNETRKDAHRFYEKLGFGRHHLGMRLEILTDRE